VERHVNLLGILATIWGALAMLVGVSMLLLAAGALAELLAPAANRVDLAASLTAAMFVLIGVFALVWGGAHVWAAALMRRRRPLGRVLSLALAVVNLLVCRLAQRSAPMRSGCCFGTTAAACSSRHDKIGSCHPSQTATRC
jgi:hypothetical protein